MCWPVLYVYLGFGVMLGHVFMEPATINYPFEKGPLSSRFRYTFDPKDYHSFHFCSFSCYFFLKDKLSKISFYVLIALWSF